MNLYAFSADRPTAYLDPNGHEGEVADLCGGSGNCQQTQNPDGSVTVTVTTYTSTTTTSTDANGNTLTTVTNTTVTDTYTFSNVGNLVSGVQTTEVDSNTYQGEQRVSGSDQTTTSSLTLKDANQQFGTTTVGLFRDSFGPRANGFLKQVAHSIEKHPGTNAGRAIGLAVAVGCLAAEPCGGAAAAAGVGGAAGDAFDSIKDATDPSEGPF